MDTESGRFFRPDNVGMPFNSTANDYMMAINEVANLGWFATDRNQPEGKVCIYTFVPNTDKVRIDVDAVGYAKALENANISSIAATQTDDDVVRKARQQMALLTFTQNTSSKKDEFLFVIDDLHDYKSLSDFRSADACELFRELQLRTSEHLADIEQLDSYRNEYAASSASVKTNLKNPILQLELWVEEESRALKALEYEIRRLEQEALYGK
jgi:hypothetical protein